MPLNKMPGLWHRKLDEHWAIWVNGKTTTQSTPDGAAVDPFHCYVEFNGWPAGILSVPTGQGAIAAGKLANYETFCDALKAAIAFVPETT